MSEAVDLLWAMQSLDVEMMEVLGKLAQARAALDDPPELRTARAALSAAEEALRRLAADQRAAESDVEDLKAKVTVLEQRLYGETGTNPRAVAPLQAEIAHRQEQIRAREDQVVESMVASDTQQAEVRRLRDAVVAFEALHAGRLPGLRAEVAAVEARGADLKARRTAIAGRVPASALQVYRALATSGKGRPVVRMVGGTCHGCGATLPTAEAQRIRLSSDPLPRCPRCSHILKLE
jgi:predicted  nucleic acid-binding Zn-ribbon protein